MRTTAGVLFLGLWVFALTGSASGQTPPTQPDIPPHFTPPAQDWDYSKREVMIPMRDGVKLYTVLVIPKGAHRAPMILTRTPYHAAKRAERFVSPHLLAALPMGDEVFAARGDYIRVFQDVRGKYDSEGEYIMNRPLHGVLNPTPVDHSTDAFDTIDWLVKNVPESNGRVGMIGSSYEGFTVLMALIHPHPALKAAVPMCPMVDGWKGDDWFHNGAFRQSNFDYFYSQTTKRGEGLEIARGSNDDYELFLRAGSADDFARRFGIEQLPFYQKVVQHPAYDEFWRTQALDQLLAHETLRVPTLYVTSLWDQEDMYGGVHTYAATKTQDTQHDLVYLALGPWRHSGVNYDGTTIGPLKFAGNTALQFRRDVMQPFLDQHLLDAVPRADTPPAFVFETGTNVWRRLPVWPLSCASGCPHSPRKLYLQADFGLGFAPPPRAARAFDEYVSDPSKPVPFSPRPVLLNDRTAWQRWLVVDQRFVADRPDVLTYVSAPLTQPLHIAGAPQVQLFASTSGTDSDWVVKLIDVYPDEVPNDPPLGGYQLGIAMDILRGRYGDNLAVPQAIPANKVQSYRFDLPQVNHVFEPGHRLMVQIQSSWFPLYDRNPQTFVPNIFTARAQDYQRATQRVFHAGEQASFVALPVVEEP
ncbi:MAG: CocE/NonD family hydrolase [Gammaproteobacteria bacterium]|nr:CocE/NonD family hydrolase [Gammaproteobacteria bacterium]